MIEFLSHKKITLRSFNSETNPNLANTNRAYYWNKYFIISDNLEELKNYIKAPFEFSELPSSGKVLFNDSCSFTPLLLSRLNTNYKRTISRDTADFMVANEGYLNPSYWYHVSIKIGTYVYMIEKSWRLDASEDDLTEEAIKQREEIIKNLSQLGPVQYIIGLGSGSTPKVFEDCLDWTKPIVKTRDFVNAVCTTLPKPTEDELTGICNMLESVDEESYISGVNMLPYYDITGNEFPILLGLAKGIKNNNRRFESGKSKNEKYLYFRLKTTASSLYGCTNYATYYKSFNILKYYFCDENNKVTVPLEMIRKYAFKDLKNTIADNYTYKDEYSDIQFDLVDISEGVQIPDKEELIEPLAWIRKAYREELEMLQMTPRVWN